MINLPLIMHEMQTLILFGIIRKFPMLNNGKVLFEILYIGPILLEILQVILLQQRILIYFAPILGVIHELPQQHPILLHPSLRHNTMPLPFHPLILPKLKLPLEFGLLFLSFEVAGECTVDTLGIDGLVQFGLEGVDFCEVV